MNASRHDLKSYTWHPALTDTNRERTHVGVGEEVSVYFEPALNMTFPETPWWVASAGDIEPAEGSDIKFTAPSNAATANIRVYVRDVHLDKLFFVKEPSGVDHADVWALVSYPLGSIAAGMQLHPYIAPTSVSFYKVWCMEVGKDASALTGYYTSNTPPSHIGHGADKWFKLNEDNSWPGVVGNGYDFAALGPVDAPPLGLAGGFTWDIPACWSLDPTETTNSMNGWNQVFSVDSSGTTTVSKFQHSVIRPWYESTGTAH